jgi:DNA-binding GntR family transcriptional regulator
VHGARLLVETAVVEDAALLLGQGDVKSLENSLEAQRLATNDPVRFLMCDREFHLTIYYASENIRICSTIVDSRWESRARLSAASKIIGASSPR